MAHCCDGCVYERPGGQCAREDTYIEEHKIDIKEGTFVVAICCSAFIVAFLVILTCVLLYTSCRTT